MSTPRTTYDLTSFEQFAETITEIKNSFHLRPADKILYRGQEDASWRLETTLERRWSSTISLPEYLGAAMSVAHEIESLTERTWDLPDLPEQVRRIEEQWAKSKSLLILPCYEYLVYLRHHGFPSPLLDWTRSPYIAAFFAFEQQSSSDRVAVFVFIERIAGLKTYFGSGPIVHVLGPHITTHARHFSQKAQYTYAVGKVDGQKWPVFVPHPAAGHSVKQDVLVKITIPTSERIKVLKQLDEFNINPYTLFGSEDSLIRTMGLRAIDMAQ